MSSDCGIRMDVNGKERRSKIKSKNATAQANPRKQMRKPCAAEEKSQKMVNICASHIRMTYLLAAEL